MTERPPPIDGRTAAHIARQVKGLLQIYAPGWRGSEIRIDPVGGKPITVVTDPMGSALIAIFGRFAELVIERLNRVPEKNQLAFLDLLGASLLPPQAARVPLTFFLAAGSSMAAVVPAGTQVAAAPANGEAEPVIFETDRELVVTPAELTSMFVRDPLNDRYDNHSAILNRPSEPGVAAFQGEREIVHALYLGHKTLLSYPAIKRLALKIDLQQAIRSADPRTVQWEIWDGAQGIALTPRQDETKGLSQSGIIEFEQLAGFPQVTVDASTSRWLRCRLVTPITPAEDAKEGRVRASQLPTIKNIGMSVTAERKKLPIEAAFANALPLDIGKDFFPFGGRPQFGDTFYLANDEAFSRAGARITLNLTVTDPKAYITDDAVLGPSLSRRNKPKLSWEAWDGQRWQELKAKDNTDGLTKSGTVELVAPGSQAPPAATTISGVGHFWIRVRIAAGDYGKEGFYKPGTTQYQASTLVPPSIGSLTVDYEFTATNATPETVLTHNDFAYEQVKVGDKPFPPFRPTADASPSLYLGFLLPDSRDAFPAQPVALYFRPVAPLYGGSPSQDGAASASARLAWDYWNGKTWQALTVRDETAVFTRPGLVGWLAPGDFAAHDEFGLAAAYWLRARWHEGGYERPPRLCQALLNTTMASNAVTVTDETLGSSDGSKRQRFRSTHTPLLFGQRLEVREAGLPTAAERKALVQEEGDEAIPASRHVAELSGEIWMRWHAVPDFHGSGPRDRHYVLDHLKGEVRFGDGVHGLIPPGGIGNIRLARYQFGGGARGNLPAGAITQLKTTVPYVDRVINPAAAAGGADAEQLASLPGRAPRMIRHGGRAVTREDYEDLALLASPEVARAKCVPLWDASEIAVFLDTDRERQRRPGRVTVIVVPRSDAVKPVPSLELLARIQDYVDRHRLSAARLFVLGPRYVQVNVDAEVVPVSLEAASGVEAAVKDAVSHFLHPLTGGLNGKGWPWGRKPRESDFYRCIESIAGVDHVQALTVVEHPETERLTDTDHFLVYSGTHKVRLT